MSQWKATERRKDLLTTILRLSSYTAPCSLSKSDRTFRRDWSTQATRSDTYVAVSAAGPGLIDRAAVGPYLAVLSVTVCSDQQNFCRIFYNCGLSASRLVSYSASCNLLCNCAHRPCTRSNLYVKHTRQHSSTVYLVFPGILLLTDTSHHLS